MGLFALPCLVLLALAETPAGAGPDIRVTPPERPIFIKPVVLGHVEVRLEARSPLTSARRGGRREVTPDVVERQRHGERQAFGVVLVGASEVSEGAEFLTGFFWFA